MYEWIQIGDAVNGEVEEGLLLVLGPAQKTTGVLAKNGASVSRLPLNSRLSRVICVRACLPSEVHGALSRGGRGKR
jgi:hypothetical protein